MITAGEEVDEVVAINTLTNCIFTAAHKALSVIAFYSAHIDIN